MVWLLVGNELIGKGRMLGLCLKKRRRWHGFILVEMGALPLPVPGLGTRLVDGGHFFWHALSGGWCMVGTIIQAAHGLQQSAIILGVHKLAV